MCAGGAPLPLLATGTAAGGGDLSPDRDGGFSGGAEEAAVAPGE